MIWRKLLLLLTLSFTIYGCSDDEAVKNKLPFVSTITFDDVPFVPTPDTELSENIYTNAFSNIRMFRLFKDAAENPMGIRVDVDYANLPDGVEKNYNFDPEVAAGKYTAGSCQFDLKRYGFYKGTVAIKDYGNGRYRLTFKNVIAKNNNFNLEKTINGFFEGEFKSIDR